MPTATKAATIEQTKAKYDRSVGVIFTEYRGLKVKELQNLRRSLRDKGGEIQVVKNTLFRIAAGDDVAKIPEELSSGPTAVAFLYENETDCAKALFDFEKTNKKLVIKGALIGGKVFDSKQIESFSKLPPRDVLIAQVIGVIAAPLSNLVGVIEALYADPIRVIGAVADKVAEGSPIAAAPAAAPVEEVSSESPAAETAEASEPAETSSTESAPAEEAAAPTETTETEE
jgi:large subunit ribosomal protein L10